MGAKRLCLKVQALKERKKKKRKIQPHTTAAEEVLTQDVCLLLPLFSSLRLRLRLPSLKAILLSKF